MKIIDAINRIDSLMHNTFTQSDKVLWLSELEWDVKRNVIDTHKGTEVEFSGYDDNTDVQTMLIIPEPYDKVYLLWLEAQIHYYNGEYGKYNNAMVRYNEAYQEFKGYYNRTHMPKSVEFKYF